MHRAASPYNVNAIALAILPEALRDQQYVERYVAEVQRGRAALEQELKTQGLQYWPSRATMSAICSEISMPCIQILRCTCRRRSLITESTE
jgi:histidinol-phosphate/aromatic aminotransferase/cobyric acid decarboxylase-like protein